MMSRATLSILLVAVVKLCSGRSPFDPSAFDSSACPPYCPALFQPICGSDGVTYDNECQLELASCTGSPIYKIFDGECSKEFGTPKCLQACNETYEPVCASDGNTYYNECELNRTICQGSSIHKVSEGTCEITTKKECPDVCGLAYLPVCGSNGITYTNECELSKAACRDSSVSKKADGACENETRQCNDPCPAIYAPVCGSNGRTYGNDCELQSANCVDASIVKVYDGRCDGRDIFSPENEEAVTEETSELVITTTES